MSSLPVSVVTLLLIYVMPSEGLLNVPRNLSVDLLDFQAFIFWLPGLNNPKGTRYSVEFTEVQDYLKPAWNKTAGCTNITTTQCHYTKFPDQFGNYFVRVMAQWKNESSNWTTLENTFQPYKDNQLSSPDMKIDFSKQQHSIHINLSHRIQPLHKDVPLKFNVVLFRMTSNQTAVHTRRRESAGLFNFSNLPPGYRYCINASAFYTEMSTIQNLNATACIFLDQGTTGVFIICVGVLILLIISAGIFVYAKASLLRTLIKNSYIPKVLLIKGGSAAPQILNLEKPKVLPLSVSDYPQVIEPKPDEQQQNTMQDYMEREKGPRMNYDLQNAGYPEGYPGLYSSAALMEDMEDTEEPLPQEEDLVFDIFMQGIPHFSTESLYLLKDFYDTDSDSVVFCLEPIDSSEEDTDSEQAYDKSSYEPRPHPMSEC